MATWSYVIMTFLKNATDWIWYPTKGTKWQSQMTEITSQPLQDNQSVREETWGTLGGDRLWDVIIAADMDILSGAVTNPREDGNAKSGTVRKKSTAYRFSNRIKRFETVWWWSPRDKNIHVALWDKVSENNGGYQLDIFFDSRAGGLDIFDWWYSTDVKEVTRAQ